MPNGEKQPVRRPGRGETFGRPLLRPWTVEGPPQVWFCCSPSIVGVVTHWNGQRDVPCLQHVVGAACPGCEQRWRSEAEYWFMAVAETNIAGLPLPLKLTATAFNFDPWIGDRADDFYGFGIRTWRIPAQRNGRMFAARWKGALPAVLPEAPDMLETLYRMWAAPLRRRRPDRRPPA